VFDQWRARVRRASWDGTVGPPRSSNAASSFHLSWLAPPGEWSAVEATLEVLVAPSVPALSFWALQASFVDRGRASGAGHLGLQWHPQHPGSTAVNWGGYDEAGRELEGSAASLPSALANPNTRDLAWTAGTAYRLAIRRAEGDLAAAPGPPPGFTAWRGEVTDLAADQTVVVRDLWARGTSLAAPVVWSEVFAGCDDPTAVVRWSDLAVVDPGGQTRTVDQVRVNYQAVSDGGCATTDVEVDEVGIRQTTGVVRITPSGAVVRVGQTERS